MDINTAAYKEDLLTLQVKDGAGAAHSFTLHLAFNDEGACIVTSGSPNVTASGSGKFVSKGEKIVLAAKIVMLSIWNTMLTCKTRTFNWLLKIHWCFVPVISMVVPHLRWRENKNVLI